MKFAKYTFLIAGTYGILALLPQYFLEQQNNLDYPPAITHPEYYYGFIGVALAWQFVFLIVSGNPVRYRLLMLPAIFEKVSFGIPALILFGMGKLSLVLFAGGIIDLLLGAFFAISYLKTPKEFSDV